jgi:DNA polymerase-3 subunit epsilon
MPERPKLNHPDDSQRLKGSILKPDFEHAIDQNNFFFGQKVVISGTYETWPDRNELAKIVKALGADIDSGVTQRTNILIVGEGAGPRKIEKMVSNIEQGKKAVILTEKDVCEILVDLISENNLTE